MYSIYLFIYVSNLCIYYICVDYLFIYLLIYLFLYFSINLFFYEINLKYKIIHNNFFFIENTSKPGPSTYLKNLGSISTSLILASNKIFKMSLDKNSQCNKEKKSHLGKVSNDEVVNDAKSKNKNECDSKKGSKNTNINVSSNETEVGNETVEKCSINIINLEKMSENQTKNPEKPLGLINEKNQIWREEKTSRNGNGKNMECDKTAEFELFEMITSYFLKWTDGCSNEGDDALDFINSTNLNTDYLAKKILISNSYKDSNVNMNINSNIDMNSKFDLNSGDTGHSESDKTINFSNTFFNQSTDLKTKKKKRTNYKDDLIITINKCLEEVYSLCIKIEIEDERDLSIGSLSNINNERYGKRGIISFCDESGQISLMKTINESFSQCFFANYDKCDYNFNNHTDNLNLISNQCINLNKINDRKSNKIDSEINNESSCDIDIEMTIEITDELNNESNLKSGHYLNHKLNDKQHDSINDQSNVERLCMIEMLTNNVLMIMKTIFDIMQKMIKNANINITNNIKKKNIRSKKKTINCNNNSIDHETEFIFSSIIETGINKTSISEETDAQINRADVDVNVGDKNDKNDKNDGHGNLSDLDRIFNPQNSVGKIQKKRALRFVIVADDDDRSDANTKKEKRTKSNRNSNSNSNSKFSLRKVTRGINRCILSIFSLSLMTNLFSIFIYLIL